MSFSVSVHAQTGDTTNISTRYEQARNLFYNQEYSKAQSILESLLKESPNPDLERKIHYILGLSLYHQDQYPVQALKQFHRVYSDTSAPSDNLTDDALYYSSEILSKRLDQPHSAVPYLRTIQSHYTEEDYYEDALSLLNQIDTGNFSGPKKYSPGEIPPPKIRLNFREVDLKDFVITYSELTGTNILISSEINGTVTLIGKKGIPIHNLFDVFLEILKTRGYTAIEEKNHYRIEPIQEALQGGVSTEPKRSGLRSEFFNLENLPWNEVINALNSFLPRRKTLVRLEQLNRILVTTSPGKLEQVRRVISTFRVMQSQQEKTELIEYTPDYVGLTTLSEKLQTLLSQDIPEENFNILVGKSSGKLFVLLPSSSKSSAQKIINQIDRDVDEKLVKNLKIRIFRLQHAKPGNVQQKLTDLLKVTAGNFTSERVQIVVDQRQKALIVSTNSQTALDLIERTIDELDQPSESTPDNVRVFQFNYANEEEVAKTLREMKNVLPGDYPGGSVKFIPHERRRALIVAAESTRVFDIVGDVINQLDKADVQQPMTHHVYKVQNADAGPLAEKLSSLFQSGESPEEGQRLRVTADEQSNSLIITASPQQWSTVKRMLHRLDQPKQQVLVDVYIVEASRDNLRELGVQWNAEGSIGSREVRGGPNFEAGSLDIPTDNSGNPLNPSRPAGTLFGVFEPDGSSLQGILTAFDRKNKVNLLSSSHLVANNNEEASLSVGRIVPLRTQEAVTGGGVSSTSFKFEDVGVELDITPTIGSDSTVTMSVNQQIENVISQAGGQVGLPTRRTRQVQTKVAVSNSTTLVLGGLMRIEESNTNESVPYLSDIPYLGLLFQSESNTKNKRNLLVFMQPHIMSSQREIRTRSNSLNQTRQESPSLEERLEELNEMLSTDDTGTE
jgi:general secretion pathway protein D